MYEDRQKRCEYCDELFIFERSTARFCSTNCRVQSFANLKQIRLEQQERARKILERVRNLSEQDFINLRKEATEKVSAALINIHAPLPDLEPVLNEPESIIPSDHEIHAESNIRNGTRKLHSRRKNTKPGLLVVAIEALSLGFHAQKR
jgi:hypothetical protein